VTHRLLTAMIVAAALAAATASPALAARTPPGAAAAPSLKLPMSLPGDASAAAVKADRANWLVGANSNAAARPLAARYRARPLAGGTGFLVPAAKARAFAAALRARGALGYAQANGYKHRFQAVQPDPFDNGWRDRIADPNLAPPPVTPTSPLITLVDAELDPSHPEFQGGNVSTLGGLGVTNLHGTATAAVAAAPKNGVGIVGVWPGARALNVPLPESITCAASAEGISRAIQAGAAVINMSYGSRGLCVPEYYAIEQAVRQGIVPVAAAGNENEDGNPAEFPASLPHVLTVAATDLANRPAGFSNRNAAVDLSAPGVGIVTAVPVGLDEDGTKDGYMALSGTSFSAPMVAAAVAWVRQARPDLTADQVAQVIRLSANDVGRKGWDAQSGFGVLSVGNALAKAPPPADPQEPNDNVEFVNGARPPKAPFVFSGRRKGSLKALIDAFEDPRDVYRIKLRRHSRARVIVKPAFGNPQLQVFSSASRTVAGTSKHRVARSRRSGRRTERVTIRNRGNGTHVFYVVVSVQKGGTLDAGYGMTVRR
jgi:hypothetical protein